MADEVQVDPKVIEQKVAAGEELSDAEKRHLMEIPEGDTLGENKDADPEDVVDEETKVQDDSDKTETDSKEAADAEKEEAEKPEETSEKEDKEDDVTPDDKQGDDATDEKVDEDKVKREAEKAEGQEDLRGYSSRERALFFDLRRQRRRAQSAEEERDRLRFEKVLEEREARKVEEEPDDEPADDDEGLITRADAKRMVEEAVGKATEVQQSEIRRQQNAMAIRVWTQEAQNKADDDFEAIINQADDYLKDNKDAEEEVKAALMNGGNPVLTTYNLLKAHPQYREMLKKAGYKPKQNIHAERAQRMKENENKTRTTGAAGATGEGAGGYTVAEIRAMSPEEFAALPVKTRDKILRTFGV